MNERVNEKTLTARERGRMGLPMSVAMRPEMEEAIRARAWEKRVSITECVRQLVQVGLDAEAGK